MANRAATKPPVLLLMDSPRKADGQRAPWATTAEHQRHHHGDEDSEDVASDLYDARSHVRQATLVGGAAAVVADSARKNVAAVAAVAPPESLGRLLVEVTAQVQDERSKRSDVEKTNQSLMLEIEQLQRELLDLKTSREQQTRRRASGGDGDWDAATRRDVLEADEPPPASPRDGNAEFWWRELQAAKQAKDAALAEAHARAMEVVELHACVSMQHDELKALRASEGDVHFALARAEERGKELLAQHAILQQENRLLQSEVAHVNGEIGKRGAHFKALMDKWSESQAQSEHLERENRAMLDKMKELRAKHEAAQLEMDALRDERDLLQHQANHLKGAVAAKAAESKAFQAYGSNARDHLQAQHAVIQRHQIFRRKVHGVARDSARLVRGLKTALATVRAPLVTIQADFRAFLKNLQTPVLSLVARSRRFAEVAHVEHAPLRLALAEAERTRRHLHDQLWRARRNALLVCQIRNVAANAANATATTADSILVVGEPLSAGVSPATTTSKPPLRTLRANYATAELLLRESEQESVTVKCDAVFSDRARGLACWNPFESVAPLLQSVLDGLNACVATFDGLLPIKTDAACPEMGVPELVLTQLFALLARGGAHFHRVKLTISLLGVYNEATFDLLGLDAHGDAAQQHATSKIVVLEVQNAEEALLVLRGGGENLDAAHGAGIVDKRFTHRVITVCVAHENLLLAGSGHAATKSKLQIVELATGPGDAAAGDVHWEDRGRVKAHVAMENGIQALLTTLADVRVAADSAGASSSGAFVRYHSSKLTVLLQDTVKASAKFLGILALPGTATASATPLLPQVPQLDARAAQATRWMFHIRNAVGTANGGASAVSHAATDRSVEGFINRFTQHAQADAAATGGGGGGGGGGGSGSSHLPFSSTEMAERPPVPADVDPRRWEKELDHMSRRYGDLVKFTLSFYQPGSPADALAAARGSTFADDHGFYATAAVSPRRQSSSVVVNADQLTDVVIQPHELVAVDGIGLDGDNGCSLMQPPAAPMGKASRSKAKVYRSLPGHRNGGRPRVLTRQHSTLSADKAKRRVTTATMVVASSAHAVTTLAPGPSMPARATSAVKLRRETASSALKKARGSAAATRGDGEATAAPAHASSLTAYSASSSAMTAAAATQARLQNRRIPFK